MNVIQRLSVACARNIIELGNLKEINESVLRYGCELILTSIFGLMILIGLSVLIGHPFAWVFFVIGFAPSRTSAGGYHADTHARCYIITSSMFLVSAITAYLLEWNRCGYLAITVFSAILIRIMAPLAATNKPLSAKRYRLNRMRCQFVVCVNVGLTLIFAMLNWVCEEISLYYAGVFFAATSLIMGKIKNAWKGGKNNEE